MVPVTSTLGTKVRLHQAQLTVQWVD